MLWNQRFCELVETGWEIDEKYTNRGYSKGKVGYGIWISRWDWFGKMSGCKACFYDIVQLTKDDEINKKLINKARFRAVKYLDIALEKHTRPGYPPFIGVDGNLHERS